MSAGVTTARQGSSAFTALATEVAAAGNLDRKIEVLLERLADQIKGVSNDQNVQRLSRELRAETPALVEAFRIAAGR